MLRTGADGLESYYWARPKLLPLEPSQDRMMGREEMQSWSWCDRHGWEMFTNVGRDFSRLVVVRACLPTLPTYLSSCCSIIAKDLSTLSRDALQTIAIVMRNVDYEVMGLH